MSGQTFPSRYEAAEWISYAVCRNEGAAPMFPADSDGPGIEAAKANCAVCPVLLECLAGALDRGESYGVWGGLTTNERKLLRRRMLRNGKLVADLSLPDVDLPEVV